MNKHTPTPWEIFDTLDSEDDDVAPVIEIRHGHDYVATVNDVPDAAHIVHCVNAHDELVAALRSIVDVSMDNAQSDETRRHDMTDLARAALAKVDA